MRTSDGEALKARLKEEAARVGFDLAGVTTPDPPPHFDVYQGWLRAGHHGEMAYLASERALDMRRDPRRLMPQCRSILVLASSYLTSSGMQPEAGVAAYARGDDYHEVIQKRLARLAEWIEAETGKAIIHRSYTDTGPLLERELAQRAGLGWIARNTCLINPRQGSYLLLAEMLLELDLPPDEPFVHDHCGTCSRCINACPTGCILPDRTLDARRCISYLTIEHRGAIPREMRPDIGHWVFGCDVCQQVCPWNMRFARPGQDAAFQPRPFLEEFDLEALLALDPAKYQALLRRSPLKRAKRHGLLRNAALVAGNRAERSHVPALARILRDEEQAVARSHAAWALGRIGGEHAARALRDALQLDTDGEVLEEIRLALKDLS